MGLLRVKKQEQAGKPVLDLKILDRATILKKRRLYWIGRRAQDIFFSTLAIVVLSPFMLIIAVAIWLDEPHGSPIFKQIRCGKDGKPFKMYKFRSMYVGAEQKLDVLLSHNEMDGPAFKIKDDPRITKIGHCIRKSGIDELPQLFNILKGDMSIVGPRPALPREVEMYKEIWKQRMYITPGLTCYWQIAPHRNDISFDEWMAMDLRYIEERSFITDWKIIFKTVRTVIFEQGE